MTPALAEALRSLASGRDLSSSETEAAVADLLSGDATESAMAAFLTALRFKGETAEELAGAVAAVRARVAREGLSIPTAGLVDTCGTGGDGANTLNVSTAAALVVAACGVPVAKHGNRSASGNSGSAEVLSELGVAVEATPDSLSRGFAALGIAFLFAPQYHPGLRFAGPVRRQLPFRTLFNLVGPLANPAAPEFQLVGVAGEREADLVAAALARLGVRKAAVVTGSDGLDEISLSGPTRVRVVEAGAVTTRVWEPHDFGLGPVAVADLRVSGPSDSAARVSHLLAGEPGPARDVVLANVAGALWVAEGLNLRQGVERGAEAVDSGRAANLLRRWREWGRSG